MSGVIFVLIIIMLIPNSELYAAKKLQILVPYPNQPISVREDGIVLQGEGNLHESEERWDIPDMLDKSNYTGENFKLFLEIKLFWTKRAANLEVRAENRGQRVKESGKEEKSKRVTMMKFIIIDLSESDCDQVVVYDPSKQWIGIPYYIRCLLRHQKNIEPAKPDRRSDKPDKKAIQSSDVLSSMMIKKKGKVFCSKKEGELWSKRLIAADLFKIKKERVIVNTPSILTVDLNDKRLKHELRTVKHGIQIPPKENDKNNYDIKNVGEYYIYVLCKPKGGAVQYELGYELKAKSDKAPTPLILEGSEDVRSHPYKIEDVESPVELVIQVYNLSPNLKLENQFDLQLFENSSRKKLETFKYGNVQEWSLEVPNDKQQHQYKIIASTQKGKGRIRYFIQDLRARGKQVDKQNNNDEFWMAEEIVLDKDFIFKAQGEVDYSNDPIDCWRIRFADGFEEGARLQLNNNSNSKTLSMEIYSAKGKLIGSGSNAKSPTLDQNERVSFFYVRLVAKKEGTNKYNFSYLSKEGSSDKFNQIVAVEKERLFVMQKGGKR